MAPPCISGARLATDHLRKSIMPLWEQFGGQRAHGIERGWRNSARRLSVLDPMHRQATRCSAWVGFDSRYIGVQHTNACVILEQITQSPLNQSRIGGHRVNTVDEQVQ
ncbi:hypothetical protein CDEF62S_04039 [Castellaniella defragrans]